MPQLSSERIARSFINAQCAKIVEADGTHKFIGYTKSIDADFRTTVYAYAVDPTQPTKVAVLAIQDRAVILAAMDPDLAPKPAPRAPKAAQDAPAAPAAAKAKK